MSDNTLARFLDGSIMRHVVVMTLTGAIGLMAMFFTDLADLYFLSLLGDTNITAAIGFAGAISFFNLSLSLGLGIACAALVAQNLGARQPDKARGYASSGLMFSVLVSAAYTALVAIFIKPLLRLLGAEGAALDLAASYIWTLSPGFILMAAAVSCSFSLRGLGDAKRAMYITLSMAVITAILDPILIFGMGWGMRGAAITHVIAQGFGLLLGLHGLKHVHKFLDPLRLSALRRDFRAMSAIALPAVLTQLATPVSAAFITWAIAPFGNEAVSASAIVNRLVPVAFGIIFALSGSVGPIVGQNFGARKFDRVLQTLKDGMLFAFVYTLATALLLFLFRDQISAAFQASGRARDIVIFFCTWVGASWAFNGAQFVAQAAFNNLGRPALATLFNWGKATIGTVPFVMAGATFGGAEGILAGLGVGSVVFGIASAFTAFRIANNLRGS